MSLIVDEQPEDFLDRGVGRQVIKRFVQLMLDYGAKKIVLEPSPDNLRAVRCYEKAGIETLKGCDDGLIVLSWNISHKNRVAENLSFRDQYSSALPSISWAASDLTQPLLPYRDA